MTFQELYVDTKLGRITKSYIYEAIQLGKQTKEPHPVGGGTRATQELVHSDVCGPVSVKSMRGSRYFLTFIDDFRRYTWTYILKKKSDVLDSFIEFHALAERQSGAQLKCLRTDHGGEYESKTFID